MILGAVMYPISAPLQALIPWVIGFMLFLTYLKVQPKDLKLRKAHFYCLLVQISCMGLGYLILAPFHLESAEALFLCFFTPAAVAGPAIVRLLSGDSGFTASYSLLTHFSSILIAPLLFPLIKVSATGIDFSSLALAIFKTITPLIIIPMLLAWTTIFFYPKQAKRLGESKQIPYIFWIFSVWLLMGKTIVYLNESPLSLKVYFFISILVLLACLSQFILGDKLALLLKEERNALRHGLGQKNTSLAIWLATLYLSPSSALAATTYIVWQNFYITYRLYQTKKST